MLYFRIPFSEKILTIATSPGLDDVSFVSFDSEKTLDFGGTIQEVSEEDFLKEPLTSDAISPVLCEFYPENEERYTNKITEVIAFIKENELPKLVISRRKLVNYRTSKVNLSRSFLNLCEAYPNAFVYVFVEDGNCWMGAFSEVLGKFDKKTGSFETMSLAGTISLDENWTRKEEEEQKTVTNFVEGVLKNYSKKIDISETQDHISGNIKHLRTDFKATIEAEDLDDLIADLHPTPAVCGIPKDFCKKAIENFEHHDRKFYAGYIKVETADLVQYFVNLRCAQFLKNAALIYVGGGITAQSNPEKEWQETELKADAVLKNILFEENWTKDGSSDLN